MRSQWVRMLALVVILCGFIIHIYRQSVIKSPIQRSVDAWAALPKTGSSPNDTKGKILGNLSNGIQDLSCLYKMIRIYRQRTSKYPADSSKLFEDIYVNSGAYGFKNGAESEQCFLNPDSRFSDSTAGSSNQYVSLYIIMNKRPDGSIIGGAKISNQRDILAFTNMYVHRNIRYFKGQQNTENPVGSYLVLWDDGQVEQVPYYKRLFVPLGGGKFSDAFPGQAGVPANALTYDEFYRVAGWKKGPRGEEGGKGQSFNGKSPR